MHWGLGGQRVNCHFIWYHDRDCMLNKAVSLVTHSKYNVWQVTNGWWLIVLVVWNAFVWDVSSSCKPWNVWKTPWSQIWELSTLRFLHCIGRKLHFVFCSPVIALWSNNTSVGSDRHTLSTPVLLTEHINVCVSASLSGLGTLACLCNQEGERNMYTTVMELRNTRQTQTNSHQHKRTSSHPQWPVTYWQEWICADADRM